MPKKEDPLQLVTYCGLFCGLCAHRSRIPQQAHQLEQSLHDEGFDFFYQFVADWKEPFPVFWKFLQVLTKTECNCRSGAGGPPDCKIRNCAKTRKVSSCPECKDYPCENVQRLAERYPLLVPDGKRMQKIGLDKWIKEQEQRAKRGFAYADLRNPIEE